MSERLARPCWCGNTTLARYSEFYRYCADCGTLVSAIEHTTDVSRVQADDVDLYGRDYWFAHQEDDLGFANIYDRARSDLTDRAPHWLRTLLKYKAPPGRALELGSAHGGFVALLRWAGFDASGLELSPAIAAIARDLFHVPMLQGPVEDQDIEAGSLSVIALMDVLEHLPAPKQTMGRCLDLLEADGFLLIQTPKFPEGLSLDDLVATGDRFVEQLKEREHLYLFSERSVQRFFSELGANHVTFERAYFSHYDMFFTVSRTRLTELSAPEWQSRVIEAATGRAVVALLEMHQQLEGMVSRDALDAIEADRAARLEIIEQQGAELGELRHQRAAEKARAEALESALQVSEADRAARLEIIEQQGVALGEAQHERAAEKARAEALETALQTSEADRAARLEVIERQGSALGGAQHERAVTEAATHALESAFQASEADRAARLEVIERQGAALGEANHQLAAAKAQVEALESALRTSDSDRAARLALLEQQGADLGAVHAQLEEQRAQHGTALATATADLIVLRKALADAERRAARSLTQRVIDRWTRRRPRT